MRVNVRAIRRLGSQVLFVTALPALTGPAAWPSAAGSPLGARKRAAVAVVVQGTPGSGSAVERDISRVGGRLVRSLPIVDGVAASVPADIVSGLVRLPGIRSVTPDRQLSFFSTGPLGYDPVSDLGSLYDITTIIGAQSSWQAGYTGKGIDVALIDTGVAPVQGLTSGNVVNGPDLSFDSQFSGLTDNDGFGHGTHMASLIAGRDAPGGPSSYADPNKFVGTAPDARVVSVKVGAFDGSTDVSQVIAGIGWVVQHAHDPGLNIRVLSLSFGTNSTQDYRLDPLAYAAEVAWRKGIVVVAAGGNDGTDQKVLADPAIDPVLLAVGASDPMGTIDPSDDTVPSFATRGDQNRHVDVVAPGVHVLGLRSPGSFIDQAYPGAEVGSRFFRGSGTSQSTAITAGAVALFLQRYPAATPDQVKWSLMTSAVPLSTSPVVSGSGSLQVRRAEQAPLNTKASQPAALYGTGTGLLEAARGTSHVTQAGIKLTGERDIFGASWNAAMWSAATLAATSWQGGTWNGNAWSGVGWSGTSWTAVTWGGVSWSAPAWSGLQWNDGSWTGRSWTTAGWSGGSWSGRSWTDATWRAATWATNGWQ